MALNQLVVVAAAIGVTLVYASVLDLRSRRVPFRTWYPMVAIGAPFTLWFYASSLATNPDRAIALLALSALLGVVFLAFGHLNLIGGADAWALAFIALLLPTFPFTPLLGDVPPGVLAIPLLLNTGIAALLVPFGLLCRNRLRGVDGPLGARLRGYPVTAAEITAGDAFGFLMEDLSDDGGDLRRRFLTLGESVLAMLRGTRLYTRELRVEPEEHADQIALIRRASPVWIAVGVPFIVPLTAGFVATLVIGDTFIFLLSQLLGA